MDEPYSLVAFFYTITKIDTPQLALTEELWDVFSIIR